MKVFLIRHAESKANVLKIDGGSETELSDSGIKQARMVAKRFVGINVDVILCSRYKRAMQTAKIINGIANKHIVYNNLPGEWRMPSEFQGKIISKEDNTKMVDRIYEILIIQNGTIQMKKTYMI